MPHISLRGVRVNNLRGVSLDIPRDRLIAVTGVSGSGKSSLAFDTLYAEGQRRYVESLSAYARQFLGRMAKPACESIKGLPPTIAIEQKVTAKNPRSTVGTSTEIYEYLRLLFARTGHIFSPVTGREVRIHSVADVVCAVSQAPGGQRMAVAAPLHVAGGRTLRQQLEAELRQGYSRLIVAGDILDIADLLDTADTALPCPADCSLLIDRLTAASDKDTLARVADSAQTAFYEGAGTCRLFTFKPDGSVACQDFCTRLEADGLILQQPDDKLFAFNSPAGWCPTCEGFGRVLGIDEKLVVPNTSLSVHGGCVQCWHGEIMGEWQQAFCREAGAEGFPLLTPYYDLSARQKDRLWHGAGGEDDVCIDAFFRMVCARQSKIQYRVMLSRYRGKTVCPDCRGTRLRKEALWVRVAGKTIAELVAMPVGELCQWADALPEEPGKENISRRLLPEIRSRLHFLVDVGLDYLTLDRPSATLSGGESQRINLTTSLGSPLVGSLYILDEPSIGLHPRDTARLIAVLRRLQQEGNTVMVVEHDEEVVRAADWLIDVGPAAGRLGGEIVYQGPLADIEAAAQANPGRSATVDFLTGRDSIPTPASRRPWNRAILLRGARMNNLRGIDVRFPLNVLTAVTGVSGSGKSTLVKGILYPAIKRRLDEVAELGGEYSALEGDIDAVRHVELVDQNPIGRSTRSNPVIYTKAYDPIRALYADQPLAKQLGFTAQHFSFNTDGGRCDVCKGAGVITVEMQFMADLQLTCEACHGQRFKKDVLDVHYKGKNISDVLLMTVSEALDFFDGPACAAIRKRLQPLADVGLGYIQLGQSSSTLSGGESQRVKLATFIGQEKDQPTLFLFDEPTTGLHPRDIKCLLRAFDALISRGHTIVVIEHNTDVIRNADHIIDLGPEGGAAGGQIVAEGTPEHLCQCPQSLTGQHLNTVMKGRETYV